MNLKAAIRIFNLLRNEKSRNIIIAISVIGKTVTPTPGGIIGAEAGLFAGLIAYGISASPALVIVVTYRLLTYWVPFLIGTLAFAVVKKKRYI